MQEKKAYGKKRKNNNPTRLHLLVPFDETIRLIQTDLQLYMGLSNHDYTVFRRIESLISISLYVCRKIKYSHSVAENTRKDVINANKILLELLEVLYSEKDEKLKSIYILDETSYVLPATTSIPDGENSTWFKHIEEKATIFEAVFDLNEEKRTQDAISFGTPKYYILPYIVSNGVKQSSDIPSIIRLEKDI